MDTEHYVRVDIFLREVLNTAWSGDALGNCSPKREFLSVCLSVCGLPFIRETPVLPDFYNDTTTNLK